MLLDFLNIGSKLIDKLIPDPAQKAQAQLELLKLQQNGELEELRTETSAILAEANSADKWTSRARPTFLYVCYISILAAIPMGIVSAISPSTATDIAKGYKAWLDAIPQSMWQLMGIGYLGYVGGRSFDKWKGNAK